MKRPELHEPEKYNGDFSETTVLAVKTSEKANVHNRTGLHMLFTSVAQTLHELYTSIETTSKRILVAQPINYHTCVVRRGLCICALSVLLSQQRQQIPEGN